MLMRSITLTAVALCTIAGVSGAPEPGEREIFAIGRADHSFTEFSRTRDAQTPLVYRVGTSQTAEWPAYHPGTFDMVVGRSTMERDWTEAAARPLAPPLKIAFDLT